MINEIISPDYQWKEAASQEGVDYAAVQKSFMDQSYGVVANKAKILFQDPFRLGFEIVNRNEKATKMVGIFAFRVNKNLLYAPTFFVNGEIKPADMLYRADVKRFVPLSEEWCAYLVRGVHENSGECVDKNRMRQADAYMDRLAYPQRVKYAADKQAGNPFTVDGSYPEEAPDLSDPAQLEQEIYSELVADAYSSAEDPETAIAGITDEQIAALAANPEFIAKLKANYAEKAAAAAEFKKVASDGSLWKEIITHCADDSPLRKLLPEMINEFGPDAIEKVASFIGDSDTAARYLASHYTREELETVDGWMAKEAANDSAPAILIITDPRLAKTASAREAIFDRGYELVDQRKPEMINTVIEEIGDGTVKALSTPGKATVLLDDGSLAEAVLFRTDDNLLHDPSVPMSCCPGDESPVGKPDRVYFPKDKQMVELGYKQEVYGDEMVDQKSSAGGVDAAGLQIGKCYVACADKAVSPVICIKDKAKDGECTKITYTNRWGDESQLFYAPGRSEAQGRYISDETLFLEVKCDIQRRDEGDEIRRIEPMCDHILMSSSGISDWIRTAGGVTSSREVSVKPKAGPTFDIEHRENGTLLKKASNLGWLEAHLKLAEDFDITTDMAGKILDKAVNKDVHYRIFDTVGPEKRAYLTRPQGMEEWIQSFDPELQVRLDAPQQQTLSTFTPRRPDQQQRYGDTYQRVPAKNSEDGQDLMPMDAIMSQSPEALAQMSEMYQMPHIFDHGCVGQMATTTHNITDQIKKYIPDIENGVDRYFRILFLLRYRPSDFEEMYGKDDLVEFEQDLTDLASLSGDQLLTMLRRFEPDQYAAQEN